MYIYVNPYLGWLFLSEKTPDDFTGVVINREIHFPAHELEENARYKLKFFAEEGPFSYDSEESQNQWKHALRSIFTIDKKVYNISVFQNGNEIFQLDIDEHQFEDNTFDYITLRLAMILSRTVTSRTKNIILLPDVLGILSDSSSANKISDKSKPQYFSCASIGAFSLNKDNTLDYVFVFNQSLIGCSRSNMVNFYVKRMNNLVPFGLQCKFRKTLSGLFDDYDAQITFVKNNCNKIQMFNHDISVTAYVTESKFYKLNKQVQSIVFNIDSMKHMLIERLITFC